MAPDDYDLHGGTCELLGALATFAAGVGLAWLTTRRSRLDAVDDAREVLAVVLAVPARRVEALVEC